MTAVRHARLRLKFYLGNRGSDNGTAIQPDTPDDRVTTGHL